MSITVAWVMAMTCSFGGEHAQNKRHAGKIKIARVRRRPLQKNGAMNRFHGNPDNE
jgi:hypothetical protein